MPSQYKPKLLRPGDASCFPNPERADERGLVAIGGDLSPERLLSAYRQGIFPWYDEGLPPLWWSPNPRAVLERAELHISRSMRRHLRTSPFELTWNQAFKQIVISCGSARTEGTWILPEMVDAYVKLHDLGHAHSIEVWDTERRLIGGLYGVQCGALFAAESMFQRREKCLKGGIARFGPALIPSRDHAFRRPVRYPASGLIGCGGDLPAGLHRPTWPRHASERHFAAGSPRKTARPRMRPPT